MYVWDGGVIAEWVRERGGRGVGEGWRRGERVRKEWVRDGEEGRG